MRGLAVTVAAVSVVYLSLVLGADYKTLDVDNLMLLNVAVKGRLVNKMTAAIEEAQRTRHGLAESVKDCLVKASAGHVVCRECVRNLCEKRTLQCNGNITNVETILKREEETPIPEVKMVEPDVKLAESVIEMSKTAANDIVQDVPQTLQDQGHNIVEKAETESKLETLRRTIGEGFNKALDTIPKLIPQVKDAFITMETQMSDPQTIDRLANDAAQQVATAMQGKQEVEHQLNRQMNVLHQNIPQIMNTVNAHVSNIMSSVSSFMKSAVTKISQIEGGEDLVKVFNIPNSDKQWSSSIVSLHVMKPDGEVTSWSNRQNQLLAQEGSFSQNHVASGQFNQIPGGPQMSQIPTTNLREFPTAQPNIPTQARWRLQRSSNDVSCDDIDKDPKEACENYHFRCQACANDTILLQHSCGKTALKKMVDIKMLDMRTAMYVTVYTKYVRSGLVVQQVKFDEDSYDSVKSVYRSAFITAKIGQKIITYETSSLPTFTDLTTSGGEIGEELWEIMNNEDEFEPGYFVKSFENELAGAFMLRNHSANSGSVQSSVNSVVFTVTGLILYFGFLVL